MHLLGADQAAIRGGRENIPSAASSATRAVHQEVCDDIAALRSLARLHGHPGISLTDHRRRRQPRILHRRAPWLSAWSSIMSAISATASPSSTGRSVYVPYTLGGETRGGRRCAAAIPTAGGCWRSNAPARNGSRRSAAFRDLRRLRDPALGRGTLPRLETRSRGRDAGAGKARLRGCAADRRPWPGRRRITLHARMGTHEVLKVGFAAADSHDIVPVDRCPILDPGLRRRAGRGLGAGRAVDADRKAARYPDHRDRQRPRCRCPRLRPAAGRAMIAALSRIAEAAPAGAADAAWRTGADAPAADDRDRRGAR